MRVWNCIFSRSFSRIRLLVLKLSYRMNHFHLLHNPAGLRQRAQCGLLHEMQCVRKSKHRKCKLQLRIAMGKKYNAQKQKMTCSSVPPVLSALTWLTGLARWPSSRPCCVGPFYRQFLCTVVSSSRSSQLVISDGRSKLYAPPTILMQTVKK